MTLFLLCQKTLVFLVAISSLLSSTSADDSGETSCTSSVCQETGEEIISSIDESVDPCTDFFQHACGGWMVKHPVKKTDRSSDQFTIAEWKVEYDLKDILEHDDPNDSQVIRNAKYFYKTCLDQGAVDARGLQPLMDLLIDNGNWPLAVPSHQWNPQHLTWQQIHENFMKVTDYPGLFQLTVDANEYNTKAHVITLITQTTPHQRNRWLVWRDRDSSKLHKLQKRNVGLLRNKAYNKYILSVAETFAQSASTNISTADIEANVIAMRKFELQLENISDKCVNSSVTEGHASRIITIKEAQGIWDAAVKTDSQYKIDWLETIKRRFEGTGIVIDENEKLAINPGDYLESLATLLSKTPIRTIVNYIHWVAIERLLPYGDRVLRRIELQYLAEIQGNKEELARWRTCLKQHVMPHAISTLYAKKRFTALSRASVLEMIHHLRETSKENVGNAKWMNEVEKQLTKEKIDAIVNRIGYPDWYEEIGRIDEYYSELTIGPNYFENILAGNQLQSKKSLLNLRKPASAASADWPLYAFAVNAAYSTTSNSINFPAAFMQMPIFHYEKPASLKFGGIGATIGHEISHAFDYDGRLADKDGNKHNWWSNSTITKFDKIVHCFVEQYQKFEITKNSTTNQPIYVNGFKTLDETLGDNAGFAMSFKAFQRYKRLHPYEKVNIPALKGYSDEQLYFYGLANLFCDVLQPEFLENTYPRIPYPPNKARINGALSNMVEFATTFGCPAGSKMNPTDRCVLWH